MTEYYDKLASGYDELYGDEQRAKYSCLRDWLASLSGATLDVGSGTGIINEFFNPLVLTDSSFGMIKLARGTRIVCDAHFLPFKDKSFDNITCFTVLQDVIDKGRVVSELSRVASEHIILTITKRLKSRDELESLFTDLDIIEYREEARDHCFLLGFKHEEVKPVIEAPKEERVKFTRF